MMVAVRGTSFRARRSGIVMDYGKIVMETSKPKEAKAVRWRTKWTVIGIEFGILYIFWILLSGRYQIKYLLIGLAATAIVTYLTHDLLYNPQSKKEAKNGNGLIFSSACRLPGYILWLVWAIIKANIQIALIILNPRMPIDPGMVQFKTGLRNKISRVTLANSITLTPGTITVELINNTYTIHSLVRDSAGDLESGLMQKKVGCVFSDFEDTAPECTWTYCGRENKQ